MEQNQILLSDVADQRIEAQDTLDSGIKHQQVTVALYRFYQVLATLEKKSFENNNFYSARDNFCHFKPLPHNTAF